MAFSESHLLRAGFPHSDISGSKLVCQLPGAYRRLPRPSSPVIAKASTTCTYSLDPITLSPQVDPEVPPSQVNSCLPASGSFCAPDATIQSNPSRFFRDARAIIIHDGTGSVRNRDLYFFRIFKERN